MSKTEQFKLLLAADTGNLQKLQELIAQGVDVNAKFDGSNPAFNQGAAAIHYATRSGHFNIVKQLLENHGAQIDILDIEDWTPLHYACYNGHFKIAKYLLDKGCNRTIKDNYLFKTALQFAEQFGDIIGLFGNFDNNHWHRTKKDLEKKQQKRKVFEDKKSKLFMKRYRLEDDGEALIYQFRETMDNPSITFPAYDAVDEFAPVQIKLTHSLEELRADTEDKDFVRSCTIATGEYMFIVSRA